MMNFTKMKTLVMAAMGGCGWW